MQSETICAALGSGGIFIFSSLVHATLKVRKNLLLFFQYTV